MKERPILMTTESVKAILDGRKTMTRRVVKLQPTFNGTDLNSKPYFIYKGKEYSLWSLAKVCPYGQVGDRLWVRETWRTERRIDNYAVGNVVDAPTFSLWYKTTPLGDRTVDFDQQKDEAGKWRPSIFMPRWASRLTLEITEVRVERLQEISHQDAYKEGCKVAMDEFQPSCSYMAEDYRENFIRLWDSLNAKRGYGWETNPWVWVLKFDNKE